METRNNYYIQATLRDFVVSLICFLDFYALSKCFVLSHLSVNIDATFSKKYPLSFRFYHQRYQQVVEKPSEKAVLILGRAINGAITYTLLFASPPQNMPPSYIQYLFMDAKYLICFFMLTGLIFYQSLIMTNEV